MITFLLALSAALPSFILYLAMVKNDPTLYAIALFGVLIFLISLATAHQGKSL